MRFFGSPIVRAATDLAAATPDLSAAAATGPRQVGLQSPFAESDSLSAIVWADLTGQEAALLSRSNVMAIPAVARQRHLMCGVAARCPLRLIEADGTAAASQPAWLTSGSGFLSAYHRMLWSIDDLIFYPYTVWRWDANDVPERIPPTRCDVDAAANAARNPSAYLELHYEGEEPLTTAQKDELISDWAKARKGLNGGVAYTNRNLTVIEHGTHESHLLIEGRNADAVDASRLVSSPAAMADATSAGASLTYETTEGRNTQFLDYGAALYMDALVARLSMDDVCDPGQRIAFDVSQVTALSTPATATGPQE